jgi:ATP-dependent RNA circularization protein (DNA/RNA ligase family)
VRQADEKQECYHDHNIYWDMAFKYDVENKLRFWLERDPELTYVCIQGESVGSVQGNPLKLKEDDFYVFNFIDSKYGRHPSNFAKNIVENMGMKFVPILDYCFKMPTDMEEFKQMATAPSAVNPNVMREGIVLRDPTNDFSFKNVSREYLMKHNG